MKLSGAIAQRAAADTQRPDVLSVREEGGNNRGKSVETYQKAAGAGPGDPWCACFAFYRLLMAALALGLSIPKTFTPRAYTPDWKSWAIANGYWTPVAVAQAAPLHTVQVGDFAMFYFAAEGRIGHIGEVVAVHDWGVETVEGNTGPDAGASVERNGDGVYKKKRTWSQLGSRGGFVRIPF